MKKQILPVLFSGLFLWGCLSEFTEIQPATPVPADDPDYVITLAEADADLMSLLNDPDFTGPATRSGAPRRIADRYSLGTPVPTTRAEGEAVEPYLHIFNFEDEEGFAIMSGDERVPSLLALTYGGSLVPGDTIDNPGLGIFLSLLPDYFEGQIAAAEDRMPTTRSDDGPSNYFVDQGWENEFITPFNVSPLPDDWSCRSVTMQG